jgi:hypothetical protein
MERLEMKIKVLCVMCDKEVWVNPYPCEEGWSADCPKCHRPAFISKEIPQSISSVKRKKEKGTYFVNI